MRCNKSTMIDRRAQGAGVVPDRAKRPTHSGRASIEPRFLHALRHHTPQFADVDHRLGRHLPRLPAVRGRALRVGELHSDDVRRLSPGAGGAALGRGLHGGGQCVRHLRFRCHVGWRARVLRGTAALGCDRRRDGSGRSRHGAVRWQPGESQHGHDLVRLVAASPCLWRGKMIPLSISVGIAEWRPEGNARLARVIEAADVALMLRRSVVAMVFP